MPIKGYTTEVPVNRSLGEITGMLARGGASSVQTSFANGQPSGVEFSFGQGEAALRFRLPARPDGVLRSLRRDFPRKKIDAMQVQRTAWRILRDWVAAQLALVEAGSAESEEVFLPYLLVAGRGQTLFEQFQEHRADRLLGAGDISSADVVG